MMFGRDVRDRAVVDMESAERIGYVHDLLLDAEAGRVAGLVVSIGATLLGGKYRSIPISAVHAVGPDAITVRSDEPRDVQGLDTLTHLSHLTGRKVVTQSGELLGSVKDALVDANARGIIGYSLNRPSGAGSLTSLFGIGGTARADYVRSDSRLRFGPDIIIAPDDTVIRDAETADVVSPMEEAAAEDGRTERQPA